MTIIAPIAHANAASIEIVQLSASGWPRLANDPRMTDAEVLRNAWSLAVGVDCSASDRRGLVGARTMGGPRSSHSNRLGDDREKTSNLRTILPTLAHTGITTGQYSIFEII